MKCAFQTGFPKLNARRRYIPILKDTDKLWNWAIQPTVALPDKTRDGQDLVVRINEYEWIN